ncbi:hypothetical protein [Comamonas sp. NoAH]|uniref:hypothetical protein n=1 Tax=Comamonas halotolerans TaxID=3041496 RepID=UPI0024E11CC9|nr:hypothetical protein [Comamonas sp. NoAH]
MQHASQMSSLELELLIIAAGVLAFYPMAVHGVLLYFLLFLATVLVYGVVQWRQGLRHAAIARLEMEPSYQGQAHWKGCVVDLPAQSIQALGAQSAWDADVREAQAWSLGVHAIGGRRELFYQIELRHVRKGPVGILCTLHCSFRPQRVDLLAIDALVDTMAECLGVRRSGSRMAPLSARSSHQTEASKY